jgi:hypothetical protein
MKKRFIPWQRAALAHPHEVDLADEPALTCMHLPVTGCSVMLTCGISIQIAQTFVEPV